MALAYYGARISPHMTKTPEGYLICHDVPINRIGEQEYFARELELPGDPEKVVTVYRHPEDVFSLETLASFEGKDVTSGHPPENLTPENFSAYSKGHIENVRRSGDQTLADLHIKDASLISDIQNGVVREVSCGYTCNYEPDGSGYRQTHIRGNHVAVVPKGRAGHDVAIKDEAADTAEKGRKSMNKLTRGILTAFGLAAKDAQPEEMDELIDTTADALDAVPAKEAPEAEPAKAAPAGDVMVERAPKGDDLGSKLDRIIEMLEAKSRGGHGERPLHDEEDLDKMVEKLTAKEDPESAVTVEAEEEDACLNGAARDAAVEILRRVRPAVSAISDKGQRARVVDSLLSSISDPNIFGQIQKASQSAAQKTADATKQTSYEKLCAESEKAYAARNPHKMKEE